MCMCQYFKRRSVHNFYNNLLAGARQWRIRDLQTRSQGRAPPNFFLGRGVGGTIFDYESQIVEF